MSHSIPTGVVTGKDVQKVHQLAKEKGFAMPAVNVVGSNTINTVMETAVELNSPVIIQFSNGGAQFNAGKGLSNEGQRAAIAGGVAGARHIHEMAKAYGELHRLGVAHSVEVWQDDKLVGGLYGLSLGNMFFGESMFSLASNASKVALIKLAELLKKKDFEWIDCQIYNDHLGSLGAKEVPRKTFLNLLEESMKRESHIGSWSDWI